MERLNRFYYSINFKTSINLKSAILIITNIFLTLPGTEIPVVVMTLEGTDPTLPSLYLNSHMDVVPVELEMWSYPPFEAQIHDGKVYARGSQDMKCLPVQYLEAIRRLKQAGKTFKRTIHLGFTPEEELGSYDGMAKFVLRPEWKKLNVGHCLDEGLASPSDKFRIFYSERARWWVNSVF